jgi:hypothetical protein
MGLTTVTRTWPPPKGTGDSIDAAWYEEYFVDFTTQSSAAIAHNATFQLGTRADGGTAPTWLAEEDNSGDDNDDIGTLEWVSGQGLKATPIKSTSDSNVHDSIDAPCFSVALADCVPNLTNRDVLCVQVYTGEPVTIALNHDGYGLVLYEGNQTNLGSVVNWVYMRNYYTDGARKWRVSGRYGVGTEASDSGGVSAVPGVIEIVLYPGDHAVTSTSTSTSDIAPLSSTSNRGWCRAEPVLNEFGSFSEPSWKLTKTASGARIGLVSYKHNSNTSFYNYFKKVRILRLAGRAGGAD